MTKLSRSLAALLSTFVICGTVSTAGADNWRYRGHDMHGFGGYNYDVWRHGYWDHGWHDGRFGWWWFGGGLWYLYPFAVQPYPNPYVPPVFVVQPPPPPSVPPSYWYYCDNPAGYYPYIARCYSGWRAVPATP